MLKDEYWRTHIDTQTNKRFDRREKDLNSTTIHWKLYNGFMVTFWETTLIVKVDYGAWTVQQSFAHFTGQSPTRTWKGSHEVLTSSEMQIHSAVELTLNQKKTSFEAEHCFNGSRREKDRNRRPHRKLTYSSVSRLGNEYSQKKIIIWIFLGKNEKWFNYLLIFRNVFLGWFF